MRGLRWGVADRNDREIAALRRKCRRAQGWFFACLLLMPLGFFCPCFGLSFAPSALYGVLFGAALLLPFVGLGGVLLMTGDYFRYRRALRLARLADELGLAYTYQPKRKELAFADGFALLSRTRVDGTEVGYNRMEGEWKGRPLQAVDYFYASPALSGDAKVANQQSVVVFPAGFDHLPRFVVTPLTWADRIQKALGAAVGPVFEVDGEDEFNRRFRVAGKQRRQIVTLLSDELIELLLDDPALALEAGDGLLLVFRRDTVVRDRDYEGWLVQANRVAKLLRAS